MEIFWAAQKAGHGDNSDGLGTNLFWKDTGAAHHLGNVSPRWQAGREWMAAANDRRENAGG
jgi:hypothetical protein